MTKKRANREGTLYRLPSGSWRAQVYVGGRRLSKVAKTQREAQAWLRQTKDQVDHGLTFDAARLTLDDFLTPWLAAKRGALAKNTYNLYALYIRKNIIPTLGHVKLSDLTPARIQSAYHIWQVDGLPVRPIQVIHNILRGALNNAELQGLIPYNPTRAVIVPRSVEHKLNTWTESEVAQFLVFVRGHKHEYLYHLALATGMRQGEILGLRWADIDWLEKRINVNQQVIHPAGGSFEFTALKTKHGKRPIQVGANLLAKLRAQQGMVDILRRAADEKWQEYDLVFPSLVGTPLGKANLGREFRELVKLSALPRIRFHDLRHTSISIVLNRNAAPLVVSQRSGHSRPSITTDVYGHADPSMQADIAAMMDEITTPVLFDLNGK